MYYDLPPYVDGCAVLMLAWCLFSTFYPVGLVHRTCCLFSTWFLLANVLGVAISCELIFTELSLGGVIFASTGSHCNCVDFIVPEIRRMVLFNCTSILLTHRSTVFSSGTNKNKQNVSVLAPQLRTATFFADDSVLADENTHSTVRDRLRGLPQPLCVMWEP
jgi:hypothetical protein